ncbi:MAG: hypothetical protein V8Q79_09295 [Christensenellales bacterium]
MVSSSPIGAGTARLSDFMPRLSSPFVLALRRYFCQKSRNVSLLDGIGISQTEVCTSSP